MRVALVVFSLFLPFLTSCERPPAHASAPLAHDVYLWQRSHTTAVDDAIRQHAPAFQTLVVLVAEVAWEKSRATAAALPTAHVTRVAADWPALATAPRVGLALRINAYSGPFTTDDASIRTLVGLARELIAEAAAHHVPCAELQIDFDAATSKLSGYRTWLETLRAAIAPVPLTFTALPAWLRSSEFRGLTRAADGFVLQVHSLARPRDATTPFALFDSSEAQTAIERAARIGVPFRLALPTYGYVLAFDSAGRFAGLSAEGPRPEWRDGYTTREIRADPLTLAPFVRALAADHPAMLNGIIWYRLPVAGDTLNWSWPALAAVMEGRTPAAQLHVELHADPTGLLEFSLCNAGDGDFAGPVRLVARWHEARRLAADAFGDFAITAEDAASLRLSNSGCHLSGHATQPIGWLRLSSPTAHPDVSLEN